MASEQTDDRGLLLERKPVDGRCPECGADQLMAYPVSSEGGWVNAVKCQACLHSVSREPAPRIGPVTHPSAGPATDLTVAAID
jgi:vanillate/4-hydroxybenzoate decarboxylase subunit D